MRPIVFLHIPKTAGQAIHHALGAMVGARNISPVRINTQAVDGRKMPPGYLLHSGHIDWTELDELKGDPFVFTVLRDPRERIGSFYFYMLKTAQEASPDEVKTRFGLDAVLNMSADDYFFGGDETLRRFVRSMYFNFYCTYLATRRVGGRRSLDRLSEAEILERALAGAARIERIYSTDNLVALEDDIERLYGHRIKVANHFVNAGAHAQTERRWPKLLAALERDDSRARLAAFAEQDLTLMQRLTAAGRIA